MFAIGDPMAGSGGVFARGNDRLASTSRPSQYAAGVHPKKLARLLETTALVPKILVDQVLVKLQPDETLGDRLVADGHVREADLLHTIAEGLGVRFVTASRLRDVQVPSEVLACIPLELCERHDTLPLAWNREEETLAVVMAAICSALKARRSALSACRAARSGTLGPGFVSGSGSRRPFTTPRGVRRFPLEVNGEACGTLWEDVDLGTVGLGAHWESQSGMRIVGPNARVYRMDSTATGSVGGPPNLQAVAQILGILS